MKGRINLNPMLIRPPQTPDEQGSRPLAYILEGKFPSYFAGKSIPEKETQEKDTDKSESDVGLEEEKDNQKKDDETLGIDMSAIEGQGAFLSEGKNAKVFVMASSEMLRDNMLDENGRTPNAMFIMNVLDFLNNREDTAIMRSKQQRFNPLADTHGTTKTLIKAFNIAGLPVLVVVFGLLVWFRRHTRKKRIQLMFQ
jgi:hypothetical protein